MTPDELSLMQSVGGENDGPARQLARFVKDVAENDAMDPWTESRQMPSSASRSSASARRRSE